MLRQSTPSARWIKKGNFDNYIYHDKQSTFFRSLYSFHGVMYAFVNLDLTDNKINACRLQDLVENKNVHAAIFIEECYKEGNRSYYIHFYSSTPNKYRLVDICEEMNIPTTGSKEYYYYNIPLYISVDSKDARILSDFLEAIDKVIPLGEIQPEILKTISIEDKQFIKRRLTSRSLNVHEQQALETFNSYGLTEELLLMNDDGEHEFTEQHYLALKTLINVDNQPINIALAMLSGLTWVEAFGIAEGLIQAEVMGLTTPNSIQALKMLKPYGLTNAILRKENNRLDHELGQSWHYSDRRFKAFYPALCDLVINRNLPLEETLSSLYDLSSQQLEWIPKGLLPSEVVDLDYYQIKALNKMSEYGLNRQMLIEFTDKMDLTFYHYKVLRTLIIKKNLSPQIALITIKDLTRSEAEQIYRGATSEEAIGTNWHQAHTLTYLSPRGLTLNMLKQRHDGGHEFGLQHSVALIVLMAKKGFSAQEALAEIDGLDSEQAKKIVEGMTRKEILSITTTKSEQYVGASQHSIFKHSDASSSLADSQKSKKKR